MILIAVIEKLSDHLLREELFHRYDTASQHDNKIIKYPGSSLESQDCVFVPVIAFDTIYYTLFSGTCQGVFCFFSSCMYVSTM